MDNLNWLNGSAPHNELLRLRASGELREFLPEVDALFGVPQAPEHHPEIDTGQHLVFCLEIAQRLNASPAARFAVLVHDLGKALTPADELPRHIDHERCGLVPVARLCDRFGVPGYWRKLALLVCEFHLNAHRAVEMRTKSTLKLLSDTGMETDATLLDDFVVACESDKRGRLNKTENDYPQGRYLRQAAFALRGLTMAPGTPLDGHGVQRHHRARLDAVNVVGLPFKQDLVNAKLKQANFWPA
jgi:tRNA nucleotidyltransferase (CCA-adding enzyme)